MAEEQPSLWDRRRASRAAMLARLHRLGDAVCDDPELTARRRALLGAQLPGGELVAVAASRSLQWRWDLAAERQRLAACEGTVVAAHDGAAYQPVALRCGSRLCPVCFAARAGRAVHRWGPILEAALFEDARVWHITLTQPQRVAHGSAVMPWEAGRWIGVEPQHDEPTIAVAGEGAFDAYTRWLDTWRKHRSGRAGSEVWDGTGCLRGVEWTLRRGRGPARQRPRWHCHGHILVVALDNDWHPEPVAARWCRLAGASMSAQHWRPVEGREGLVEVLKYPFKPSDLTCAGALDAWAALRGSRTHQVGGALHRSSNAAQDPELPWGRWLDEVAEESPWRLLWHKPKGADEWALFTANDQPTQGYMYRLGGVRQGGGVLLTQPPPGVVQAMEAHPLVALPEPGKDLDEDFAFT